MIDLKNCYNCEIVDLNKGELVDWKQPVCCDKDDNGYNDDINQIRDAK